MASQYTYFTCDLRTGNPLAILPLTGVTFTRELNHIGTFTGNLPLGSDAVKQMNFDPATGLSRTALYVDRDGQIMWSGILWTRRFQESTQVFTIAGTERWSYFHRRRVRIPLTYTNVDQLAIVRDLLSYAQGLNGPVGNYVGQNIGGNINVALGSELSGILSNAVFALNEFQVIGEAIETMASLDTGQLAGVGLGFDFSVESAYVAGNPTTVADTFKLWYPRKGVAAAVSGYVLELTGIGTGNIYDYDWPEDGTSQAMVIDSVGANNGTNMLVASAAQQTMIDNGFPLLEDVTTYKSETNQAVLQGHANADVKAFASPIVLPVVTLRPDVDPKPGTYQIGDEVRLRITDTRFPAGLDTYMRIVNISVTPESDAAPETVKLTLGPVLTS